MRKVLKTANKLDNVLTAIILVPAVTMLVNAGIETYQGGQGDFRGAAQNIATSYAGQYSPYVEATGGAIAGGVGKLTSLATNCLGNSKGGNGKPLYLNPAHQPSSKSNDCNLTGTAAQQQTTAETTPVYYHYKKFRPHKSY